MKPAMWAACAAAGHLLLGACSPSPTAKAEAAGTDDGWTQPPTITSVQRAGATMIIGGVSEPSARVVLRSAEGAAYAVTADETGRFQIRVVATSQTLLLQPETQVGQDAATSPEQLLLIEGGRGPVALLRPGQSTRRLDAAPSLGAVDSDGGQVLASGVIAAPMKVAAGGREASVSPDATGRWSLLMDPGDAVDIQIGGRNFTWPGPGIAGQSAGPVRVERAGAGWRVKWVAAGRSQQTTWLPDA